MNIELTVEREAELFDLLAEEDRIHELDDGEIDLETLHLDLLEQGAFQNIDASQCNGSLDEETGYYESRYPFLF